MFDAIINPEGDLIIVHFSGNVDVDESEQCYQHVKSMVHKAKPGFTAITDLESLTHMDYECTQHVSAIMDLFNEAQVSHVYRIIPDTQIDIGWNIMSQFHYDGKSVRTQTVPTFYEAMKSMFAEKSMSSVGNI